MALSTAKIIVELHDGRKFDITHLPPGKAVPYLRGQGIQLADIKNTIHHLSGPIPPIEWIEWP
jgi:hypothetical protein